MSKIFNITNDKKGMMNKKLYEFMFYTLMGVYILWIVFRIGGII